LEPSPSAPGKRERRKSSNSARIGAVARRAHGVAAMTRAKLTVRLDGPQYRALIRQDSQASR
jgi:hypothetical protein